LLKPFFKQRRVVPVQLQDCRETEKDKPDAEDPAFGPGEISGKEEEEEYRKYQDGEEGEDDLLLHA
jgi:hypothetical protein